MFRILLDSLSIIIDICNHKKLTFKGDVRIWWKWLTTTTVSPGQMSQVHVEEEEEEEEENGNR